MDGLGAFIYHSVILPSGSIAASVDAWINPTRHDSNNAVVSLANNGVSFGVRFDPDGAIHAIGAGYDDNNKYVWTVSGAYVANEWTPVRIDADLVAATFSVAIGGIVGATGIPAFPGSVGAENALLIGTDNNIIAGTGGGTSVYFDNLAVVATAAEPVPEPGTLLLLATGAAGAAALKRGIARRKAS